jgi:hypothetical protein
MTCKTVLICPYCGEDTKRVWPGVLACEWCYVWWAETGAGAEAEAEADECEAALFWLNERDR